jgi:Flp pilus assembly protein TadG
MMRRLLFETRAVLPIEFALIIPLVFALVFGAVDVSRVLLAQNLIGQLAGELADILKRETSVEARAGLTPEMAEALIKGLAADFAGGLVTADRLTLTVSAYPDLAAMAAGAAGGEAGSLGAPGQLIAYRLEYTIPLVTRFATLLYDGGDVTRTAVVVSKNGR